MTDINKSTKFTAGNTFNYYFYCKTKDKIYILQVNFLNQDLFLVTFLIDGASIIAKFKFGKDYYANVKIHY